MFKSFKNEKYGDMKVNEMSNIINQHHFEIHLTVNLEASNSSLENFINFCTVAGIKPIVIGFDNNGHKHVMTSDTTRCTLNEVYSIAAHQTLFLEEAGFKVIRVKIEADPSIVKSRPDVMLTSPDYCYVETHILCNTDNLKKQLEVVKELSLVLDDGTFVNPHISKNEFKQDKTFITYRSKALVDFDHLYQDIYTRLLDLNVISHASKIELEVCIYDSNVTLDNQWMK